MGVFWDKNADHGIDPVWRGYFIQEYGLVSENQGKWLDTHNDRAKDQLIFLSSLLFPQGSCWRHIPLMQKCNCTLFD